MKYILSLALLSCFQFGSASANENVEPDKVVVSETLTGSLVVEKNATPGAVNYLLSTDESSGVISLTPFGGEREWIISDNLSTTEETLSYCNSLGGNWKAPATQDIDIELRKDDASRPDAITAFLKAVPDDMADSVFLTPTTYVTDKSFVGKLAYKHRNIAYGWQPSNGPLEFNRALCFKENE